MSAKRQLQRSEGRWVRGHPRVWVILVAATIGCFTTQAMVSYAEPDLLKHWFALSREGVREWHLWQFVTSMFLHGPPGDPDALWFGLLHLAVNMLALCLAGREVEAFLGRGHFIAIYFGGGILGGIAQLPFSTEDMVGASAGVFAVVIAFTTIVPEVELRLFFLMRMKAKWFAAVLVGTTALLMVFHKPPYVAHTANLVGAIFGWLYIKKLGFGNPLPFQRYFLQKRMQEIHRVRLSPAQFLTEEVDPILDKITREGMRSLTRHERRMLEMGSEKLAAKVVRR